LGVGNSAPTVALDVSGAGEFTSSVTASAFYYSSDKELKMDVKKINSALEDIKKLEGIEFKWKENGEKSYGLIAQDVEKIYPELVGTREVFNETTNETKTYKTVQYGNLVAPLIESVKELDEKDSDLELEIRNLEEEVMGQEKRIEELEKEMDELRKLVLNGQEDLLN
jgi:predicted RNase H-like nuclease (RuvC/YqgF family)